MGVLWISPIRHMCSLCSVGQDCGPGQKGPPPDQTLLGVCALDGETPGYVNGCSSENQLGETGPFRFGEILQYSYDVPEIGEIQAEEETTTIFERWMMQEVFEKRTWGMLGAFFLQPLSTRWGPDPWHPVGTLSIHASELIVTITFLMCFNTNLWFFQHVIWPISWCFIYALLMGVQSKYWQRCGRLALWRSRQGHLWEGSWRKPCHDLLQQQKDVSTTGRWSESSACSLWFNPWRQGRVVWCERWFMKISAWERWVRCRWKNGHCGDAVF